MIEKSDRTIDSYLLALKCVLDWFFTSKMVKKFIILYFLVMMMSSVIEISNDIGLNSLNCNNVNLDENNIDDCDPATVNHVKQI